MRKSIIIFILLFHLLNVKAQNLSLIEKQIIQSIQSNYPQTIQLLKDAVNINSGSLNKEGVRKVGSIMAEALEHAGLKTEWISLPDSLNRAGHLVATHAGKKGKKIFIIGHLDTVFELDMPFSPFTMLNDSTATGQGVNDMKGGDIVVIAALQALNNLGLLNDASITVYFTGDEEKVGHPVSVSRKDFIERAKQCDVALGFETAIGLHTVATARRGSSSWKLEVSAKPGHSAGIFSNGYGSIYEAARIMNSFREQLSNEKYLTFNPGIFTGGSEISVDEKTATVKTIGKTNIISPATYVNGDLRFLSETQKENARTKMKAIVANHLAGTNAQITFTDGIPAMEPTDGNKKLQLKLDAVSKAMGIGQTNAGDPGSRGAGDISYVAKYVDCLDGLGASGKGAHAPGETINLKELPFLIQRAALFIYRLTQDN